MRPNRPTYVVPSIPDPASIVVPGQHVLTAAGQRAIVAYVHDGVVFAWVGMASVPRACIVRGDAYGGEHDLTLGLAAA